MQLIVGNAADVGSISAALNNSSPIASEEIIKAWAGSYMSVTINRVTRRWRVRLNSRNGL